MVEKKIAMDIKEHEVWFQDYVAKEIALEGEDVGPMVLKRIHTENVLANARTIVENEHFSLSCARACLLAALYHDVARFEQYRLYRTFKDRDSINHGHYGVRILKKYHCLANEPKDIAAMVMGAVCLHNCFILPRFLPENILLVTKVTRDSDKLDILRVIYGHLTSSEPYRKTVLLQLPDDPAIYSPLVLEKALSDSVASYNDLRSVNDFRVLLASWYVDMNFSSSKKQFIEQGYAKKIVEALPEEGVYSKVRRYMLEKLSHV